MVDIAPGMLEYMSEHSGAITVQIREADPEAARQALERAVDLICEIESIDEPGEAQVSCVSRTMMLPDGPCVTIDMPDAEHRQLEQVIDAVAESLVGAGVDVALIAPPRAGSGPWAELESEMDATDGIFPFNPGPRLSILRNHVIMNDGAEPIPPLPEAWAGACLRWLTLAPTQLAAADEDASMWFQLCSACSPLSTRSRTGSSTASSSGLWPGGSRWRLLS